MNRFGLTRILALLALLVAVFMPAACTSAASRAAVQPQLPGTQWALGSFGPAGEHAPVAPSSKLTLVFQEGDTLSGSAGCNGFSGSYTVDGDKLVVVRLASTLRACADPNLMAQETRYLTALQKASSYRLDRAAETLRIDYDEGKGTLHFVRN